MNFCGLVLSSFSLLVFFIGVDIVLRLTDNAEFDFTTALCTGVFGFGPGLARYVAKKLRSSDSLVFLSSSDFVRFEDGVRLAGVAVLCGMDNLG